MQQSQQKDDKNKRINPIGEVVRLPANTFQVSIIFFCGGYNDYYYTNSYLLSFYF